MKKVVIRVDDVGQCLPEKRPDLKMERYAPFHEELCKRDIPYCPCIIPGICDEDMIAWMTRNFYPSMAICLHGWDHVPTADPDNEFGGIGRDEKLDKIRMGIERMARLEPKGMSAPYNRYDTEVLEVCADLGLKFFFGGYGRERYEEFSYPFGMLFLPATESLYMRGKDSDSILKAFEELPEQEHPYVLTLHATWQQLEPGETFLSDLFDSIKDSVVSPLDFVLGMEGI